MAAGRRPSVCTRRSSAAGIWQRIRNPSASRSGGATSSQIGPTRRGHRKLNTHPRDRPAATAGPPFSTIRSRPAAGSGSGTAESSASVYGCHGGANTAALIAPNRPIV